MFGYLLFYGSKREKKNWCELSECVDSIKNIFIGGDCQFEWADVVDRMSDERERWWKVGMMRTNYIVDDNLNNDC